MLNRDFRKLFDSQPSQEIETYIELQCPSKPLISHHLFIWVSCASLYVDRDLDDMDQAVNLDLPIRIEKGGERIGSICLDWKWRESEPDNMDFFVSTVGIYPAHGPHSRQIQLGYKIILMNLYHKSSPPAYRRIQVSSGRICWLDWKLAKPQSHLIALV